MKQLTVRQSEQKGKMFMRKNTDSLRKSASYVDFLEIKTYNIQKGYVCNKAYKM